MTDAQPISATDITESVIRRFDGCPDPRLREIMQAFVAHLHGFITEVALSPEEWTAAIRTLTATGEITDERRQEFILWSDTLGVSMLVDALANPLPAGATESTVLGPFYVPGSPLRGLAGMASMSFPCATACQTRRQCSRRVRGPACVRCRYRGWDFRLACAPISIASARRVAPMTHGSSWMASRASARSRST